jgi:hypothetical protein
MTRWEYTIVEVPADSTKKMQAALDQAGQQGWEAVSSWGIKKGIGGHRARHSCGRHEAPGRRLRPTGLDGRDRRMTTRRMRWALTGVLLGTLALASGCVPPFEIGVESNGDGPPVAVSCGTYITSVEALDDSTGAVLWSARVTGTDPRTIEDKGRVRVGQLPAEGWEEVVPLEGEPSSRTWRLVVGTRTENETVVVPVDGDPSTVYRSGGTESATHFKDQTCGGLPVSLTTYRVVVGICVLVAGMVVIALVVRSRRRRQAQSS